jgi:hypothetical protein
MKGEGFLDDLEAFSVKALPALTEAGTALLDLAPKTELNQYLIDEYTRDKTNDPGNSAGEYQRQKAEYEKQRQSKPKKQPTERESHLQSVAYSMKNNKRALAPYVAMMKQDNKWGNDPIEIEADNYLKSIGRTGSYNAEANKWLNGEGIKRTKKKAINGKGNIMEDFGDASSKFILGLDRDMPDWLKGPKEDPLAFLYGGKLRKKKTGGSLKQALKPMAKKIGKQAINYGLSKVGPAAAAAAIAMGKPDLASLAAQAGNYIAREKAATANKYIDGLGLKKRRGRPKKGGALYPAGHYSS